MDDAGQALFVFVFGAIVGGLIALDITNRLYRWRERMIEQTAWWRSKEGK